jgi:hypothetical protein
MTVPARRMAQHERGERSMVNRVLDPAQVTKNRSAPSSSRTATAITSSIEAGCYPSVCGEDPLPHGFEDAPEERFPRSGGQGWDP